MKSLVFLAALLAATPALAYMGPGAGLGMIRAALSRTMIDGSR